MEDQFERPREDQPSIPPSVPPYHEPPHHEPPYPEQPLFEQPSADIPPLKPNNWLWQSIVATILCCLPFGIVGIVFATKVDSLYYRGEYDESERVAKKAKMWTTIAFVVGILYLIVWIIMFSTGTLPEYIESIIEESASGYNF